MSYHLVGWDGVDYYGICYSVRQCYQRELIPPLELTFLVHDGRLYSELFTNSESDYPKIKVAINIVLELMGQCELLNGQKQLPLPLEDIRTLHWEILRPGNRTSSDIITYLTKAQEMKHKRITYAIKERHEFLNSMSPDFCAVGTQSFAGYVVYGFIRLDLYIFECDVSGNATYVFRGDWESASKLTKTEILTGNLHEARLFHTENWKHSVQSFLRQ